MYQRAAAGGQRVAHGLLGLLGGNLVDAEADDRDTRELGADPNAARDALAAHHAARRSPAAPRRAPAASSTRPALLAAADRLDAAQQAGRGGGQLADGANREQHVEQLQGVADVETVEARVVAATNQARPAAEAAAAPPRRAPRPRRGRGTSPVRDRSRSR